MLRVSPLAATTWAACTLRSALQTRQGFRNALAAGRRGADGDSSESVPLAACRASTPHITAASPLSPQEDALSARALPGDHVWTKGLRAAEPPDRHVSVLGGPPGVSGGATVLRKVLVLGVRSRSNVVRWAGCAPVLACVFGFV